MKRFLADVNLVLDAVLGREPHAVAAAKLWAAVETRQVEGRLPAHGVTTVFYLLARQKGAPFARRAVTSIVGVFGIAPVDQAVVQRALALAWPDFEDAVCAAAAEAAGCDAIVTRDPKGFPGCSLPVLTPEAAAALLGDEPPDRVAETPAVAYRGQSRRHAATARTPARTRSARHQ